MSSSPPALISENQVSSWRSAHPSYICTFADTTRAHELEWALPLRMGVDDVYQDLFGLICHLNLVVCLYYKMTVSLLASCIFKKEGQRVSIRALERHLQGLYIPLNSYSSFGNPHLCPRESWQFLHDYSTPPYLELSCRRFSWVEWGAESVGPAARTLSCARTVFKFSKVSTSLGTQKKNYGSATFSRRLLVQQAAKDWLLKYVLLKVSVF